MKAFLKFHIQQSITLKKRIYLPISHDNKLWEGNTIEAGRVSGRSNSISCAVSSIGDIYATCHILSAAIYVLSATESILNTAGKGSLSANRFLMTTALACLSTVLYGIFAV